MMKSRPLIAVLDDERQFCKALARLLKTHGMNVVTYTQGDDFLADCASRRPDCLLLDLHMPDVNGFVILERVAAWQLPVIVITGHDTPGNSARVRSLGGAAFFLKPVNEIQLLDAIRAAIEPPPAVREAAG